MIEKKSKFVEDMAAAVIAKAKCHTRVVGDAIAMTVTLENGVVIVVHSNYMDGKIDETNIQNGIKSCADQVKQKVVSYEYYNICSALKALESAVDEPDKNVLVDKLVAKMKQDFAAVDKAPCNCKKEEETVAIDLNPGTPGPSAEVLYELREGIRKQMHGLNDTMPQVADMMELHPGKPPALEEDKEPEEEPKGLCGDCYFSEDINPCDMALSLVCKRHPPVRGTDGSIKVVPVYPEDSCEEFELDI